MPFFSGAVRNNQIIIQVFIGLPYKKDPQSPPPLGLPFSALVDTGAAGTCISPEVAKKLDLKPENKKNIITVRGMIDMNAYHVSLHIPITTGNQKEISLTLRSHPNIEVMEFIQFKGFDVLLGMDILADCWLSIINDRFTLGY